MNQISRVGVVGSGLMGSGIAEVCARAGVHVVVAEAGATASATGRARIERSLARALRADKLTERECAEAHKRLRYTTDLHDLADRELVLEAVAEDEQVKEEIFRVLDKVVENREAILASNTSSIPITKLATVTQRPTRVIGMHFFNPVPVLALVEIIPSLFTDADTETRADQFVTDVLGKTVIRAADRAGFVVNGLLIPYLLAAVRMLDSALASAEDIDRGMVLGCAHPLGPLALADLIGLDTVRAVADSMFAEFKEPLYAPPPLLLRMVSAGLLGRKSGRGFHSYP
ncbi:MAG TPA: 3-hydroxybutyryl-CoA dehydrogenase [Pseudonocardiaceae bacterium]|jgi:3-hydroxybutyryl-CoA dehydrogenase